MVTWLLLVVIGDHGESFGEHHDLGHGNGVYESEVRVPLLVRTPGQREGQRIRRAVHLADIAPTVLEILYLPRPEGVEGTSLFAASRSLPVVTRTERFAPLAEAHPEFYDVAHTAIYRDRWKLIQRSDGRTELYDLEVDPGEDSNRAPVRLDLVEELREELARFEASVVPRFETKVEEPTPELLDRLRALGYVQ